MEPPRKKSRITISSPDIINNRSKSRSLRNQKRVKYGDQQQNYVSSSCLTTKAERRKRKKAREKKKRKSISIPELSPIPLHPCTPSQSAPKSQSLPPSQIIRNEQIFKSLENNPFRDEIMRSIISDQHHQSLSSDVLIQ